MFSRKLLSIAILSSTVALSACNDRQPEAVSVETAPVMLETVAVAVDAAPVLTEEKPFLSSTVSYQDSSKVTAIDHATRVVTLLDDEGISSTITVGPEARNLDQVSAGDTVTVEYVTNLTIEVVDAPNAVPIVADVVASVRAEKGEMPAAATIETLVEVSTVEAIDIEANTFKLKDADGVVTEYTARDPENLIRSKVGDVVVATLTEAMAISVNKAAAE